MCDVCIEGKRRSDRESMWVCADKCRSLESCSLRVKKVSADVETWNFVYCGCVGKPWERKQNIFRSVWDNWSASFSWSVSQWRNGRRRKRRERGKRRSGLQAGLVPITPEAWGRFVCTGKGVPKEGRGRLMLLLPTGTPRREHQLLSLLLLCPGPVSVFPHCFSPFWSKV